MTNVENYSEKYMLTIFTNSSSGSSGNGGGTGAGIVLAAGTGAAVGVARVGENGPGQTAAFLETGPGVLDRRRGDGVLREDGCGRHCRIGHNQAKVAVSALLDAGANRCHAEARDFM